MRVRNNFLILEELNEALLTIVRHDQQKYFQEEIVCLTNNKPLKSNLKCLFPFLDKSGLLRVGGRLQESNLPCAQKHPKILPKNSNITSLIILNEHIKLHHAGQRLVHSSLDQLFWLINTS